MFDRILIANRGEIACRVIRTARRLGVRTVAVYSDADANALHVEMADEAVRIGPPPARESYLDGAAVIEAARRTGAAAIHPGYGFLSENSAFAEACDEAGLVFIGPPPAAIRAMGSKSGAKALMEASGVPVVPGYHGDEQAPEALAQRAGEIGFPLLIKASAGGGGRGMRVVRAAGDLAEALASARREALNAFGDDHVILERYLTRPRHIEVQVFADGHGNALHLFERDCSVQRRHQKILEEAPAPGLDMERRREMGATAVRAAAAVGYVGAGTVEFIADEDGAFYFMEMNTRLQVEHPVTELVTGLDLVEWQLRVASGEALPLRQEDITLHGHAIEARVYAEDPSRGFLPQIGRISHAGLPLEAAGVRVDTGIRTGDEISMHYDPMIAKVIAHGPDRETALQRLRGALRETRIVGVVTNVDFLGTVAGHEAFADAAIDTTFIDSHQDSLFAPSPAASDDMLALAALLLLVERAGRAADAAARSGEPDSPWHRTDGWRLNDDNHHVFRFRHGEDELPVTVHYRTRGFDMDVPGGRLHVEGRLLPGNFLEASLDGHRLRATAVRDGDAIVVATDDETCRLHIVDPLAGLETDDGLGGGLVAPMPGRIVQVMVAAGDSVERGTPLLVLEAMKMEHTILAPGDGVIDAVRFGVGEQVAEGAELIAFRTGEA